MKSAYSDMVKFIEVSKWDKSDVIALADANALQPYKHPIIGIVNRSSYPIIHPAIEPNCTLSENDTMLTFHLPGRGESSPNCGKPISREVCPNADYMQSVICRCHKPSCPLCWPNAVKRSTDRIETQFLNYLQLRKNEGTDGGLKIYHVEISEPPEVARLNVQTANQFKKYRRKVQNHLSRFFEGGAVIYHPFRQNKKDSDDTLTLEGNVKWRDGFHFHAIVVTRWFDIKKINEFHTKTGFVLKILGDKHIQPLERNVPADRIGDVAFYTLSHAGVAFRKSGRTIDQVVYFGDMSPTHLHKVYSLTQTDVKPCPVCSGPLYDYEKELYPCIQGWKPCAVPIIQKTKSYVFSMKYNRKQTEQLIKLHGFSILFTDKSFSSFVISPEIKTVYPHSSIDSPVPDGFFKDSLENNAPDSDLIA